jgi:hypothetical protein
VYVHYSIEMVERIRREAAKQTGRSGARSNINQTIWRQGYRLRFQMTITSQLKEEGDDPTRVYGMECGGVAYAQVDNVGMKRKIALCGLARGARAPRPASPIHAVPRYTRPICIVYPLSIKAVTSA